MGILPLFFWVELLSLLVAVACFRKLKGSFFIFFIPFLLSMVIIEYTGLYLKSHYRVNGWLYNISLLIEFPFLILLFRNTSGQQKMKVLYSIFLAIFLLVAVTNLLFFQKLLAFNSNTLIAGAIVVILCACLYFYEILKFVPEDNLLRFPMFWISSGSLFHFAGIFLFFSFYDYLLKINPHLSKAFFNLVNLNLVILFYLTIGIALILYRKRKI